MIIPPTFRRVIERAENFEPKRWRLFLYYLGRHIECDAETHGPLARELVAELCADPTARWIQTEDAARQSLESRLELFDHIAKEIDKLPAGNSP